MLSLNKDIFSTLCLLLLSTFCLAQSPPVALSGVIKNYGKQPLYLCRCGIYSGEEAKDTLLLVDSTLTDAKGKFTLNFSKALNGEKGIGLYQVILQRKQSFYVLNDGAPVEMQTVYSPNVFYNVATDSLKVLKSEDNKQFFEFQLLQKHLNVANYDLLQMMRLYPVTDPFHPKIEDEFFQRYKAMDAFVQKEMKEHNQASLVAKAFYEPVNPDWKQPDPWRDSIFASHYFDYFNPADSFYVHTNILPEKLDRWITLKTDKVDTYGQPIRDDSLVMTAAQDFLGKTKSNNESFQFCLQYLLKKFNKEHKDDVFLFLCDKNLKTEQGSCEPENAQLNWAREKAGIMRGVQIGSIAPDFSIEEGKLNLASIESDYTLLIFWASWCPHCVEEIPRMKKATDSLNLKLQALNLRLTTVAVSLDNDRAAWQKFVENNGLYTWLNVSELKGWNGQVPKQYNIYATPTFFLLDRDKRIIATPEDASQLLRLMDAKVAQGKVKDNKNE